MKTNKNGIKNQGRQGDVLLQPVEKIPEGCKPVAPINGRFVLAFGEATGHQHSFVDDGSVAVLEDTAGGYYATVTKPDELEHEVQGRPTKDHDWNPVNPGTYKVIRQRSHELSGRPRLVTD